VRSLPWPSPHDDGPQTETYVPFFENRILLRISDAAYDYLMTVVAAYVNEEVAESTALSAEVLLFTNSWIEIDAPPQSRADLQDFWKTVFKVTRSIG
jgi:hypothetical protein